MNKVVAIVPAAGIGKRFSPDGKKLLRLLDGKPVIIRTLEVLQSAAEIAEIVPVVKEEELISFAELIEEQGIRKIKQVVAGGKERQDSVYNGLKSVADDNKIVLIHDGGRPFVDTDMISRAIRAVDGCDGAVVAVPVKDTIKEAESEQSDTDWPIVRRTLDRSVLYAIQTPQVFPYSVIMNAHEKAQAEKFIGTDDAALVERYGGKVRIAEGSYSNIKITTPEDLTIAEALLKMYGGF